MRGPAKRSNVLRCAGSSELELRSGVGLNVALFHLTDRLLRNNGLCSDIEF